jgi:hypothetical protein
MNPDIADSMDELRRRVTAAREAGTYGPGDLRGEVVPANAPPLVRGLADAARLAEVAPPPRPSGDHAGGVRGAAARAKHAAADLARRPVGDVAERTTAFNLALVAYVAELAAEVVELRAEVDHLAANRGDTARGGA